MEETTPQAATEVRVLKTTTCASTSGRSKLTYEVGCTPDSELHVRITANTGSGAISKNWVSLQAIRELLKGAPPGELTSGHMQKLCAGQSVNNAGFLLAVLMSEGLVRPSTSKRRAYECADDTAFTAAVNAWTKTDNGEGDGTSKKRNPKLKGAATTEPRKPDETNEESIPSFTTNQPPPKVKKPAPIKKKVKR